MTNKEAAEVLDHVIERWYEDGNMRLRNDDIQAIDIASGLLEWCGDDVPVTFRFKPGTLKMVSGDYVLYKREYLERNIVREALIYGRAHANLGNVDELIREWENFKKFCKEEKKL